MIITSFSISDHISYRIQAHEKSPEIIVSKAKKMLSDEWTEPKINWPGCGDMDIKETENFLNALKTARLVAVRLKEGAVPEGTLEVIKKVYKICP